MTVKAVLFDFDGTIADTLPVTFAAFKAVFRKYDGRELSTEQVVAMFGPTEDEILERNLRRPDILAQAKADYYEQYRQGHFGEIEQDPAMIGMLRRLQALGVRMGIVTGKSRAAYRISAEALELDGFFDVVMTGDDVMQPKPHPEGIHKALDMLGADASEALFLGDSTTDIRAGRAAGVRTYGVRWLSVSQSPVFDVTPDRVFERVDEFMELLERERS